jgi:hypothetical protein
MAKKVTLAEMAARIEALEIRVGRIEVGKPPPGDGRSGLRPSGPAVKRCSGCGLVLRRRRGRCAECGLPLGKA